MSVLGFFEDVDRGLVTGATTNREYTRFLADYERAGYVTGVGISYELTDTGRERLGELRKFAAIVAEVLVEDRFNEIDM
ncbi:MAG: hypothetical protein WC613_00905 [Candidatus Aenigmatarchaeota archaeon]